jgi:hypothetical protein
MGLRTVLFTKAPISLIRLRIPSRPLDCTMVMPEAMFGEENAEEKENVGQDF